MAQEKEKSKKDSETVNVWNEDGIMVRFECQQGPASFIAKDLDHKRQILKSYETNMESSERKVEVTYNA